MKRTSTTKTRALLLNSFVAIIIMALAYTVGYSNGNTAPAVEGQIDSRVANSYFKNYYSSARAVNDVVKGFNVDMAQLHAMNQIANQQAGVIGFRVYFGADENSKKLGIVVGVNEQGRELSSGIMQTRAGILASCPIACDEASAITEE